MFSFFGVEDFYVVFYGINNNAFNVDVLMINLLEIILICLKKKVFSLSFHFTEKHIACHF